MRKVVEKKIRGRTYRFRHFGFDEWVSISAELAKIVAPAAGLLGQLQLGGEADVGAALSQLAVAVLSGSRDGLVNRICADLEFDDGAPGSPRWVSLKTPVVRDIWAGQYISGILVLRWLLEEAFGDFFTEAKAQWPELSGLLGGAGSRAEERKLDDSEPSEVLP